MGHCVLWVEPYPTRIVRFNDFFLRKNEVKFQDPTFKSVLVINPKAIPFEPFKISNFVNFALWKAVINKIKNFEPEVIIAGKPSKLVNFFYKRYPNIRLVFDFMDNFPNFYSGISKRSMQNQLDELMRNADLVIASSETLFRNAKLRVRSCIKIPNGYKSDDLPNQISENKKRQPNFVYIGAVSHWFCWNSLIKICHLYPLSKVHIIGPCYSTIPKKLPKNVIFHGVVKREKAVMLAASADLGLIPFKVNSLTESIDPIKYYEYRCLALPVLSSKFGEMDLHANDDGLFIYRNLNEIDTLLLNSLNRVRDDMDIVFKFRKKCSWAMRFNSDILSYILLGKE
ncbi:hypothetical protein [Candidatus Photodesmus blepharus]|uniref:hypothetical protein n=1 Tax=Candidatus Photodesmus blepharonis TaxID=1179155 RepID=UPI000557E752|nr:hypothetical protein [Candidatus Photodesmus blepharus]